MIQNWKCTNILSVAMTCEVLNMDRKTLDKVWLEQLERIDNNLEFLLKMETSGNAKSKLKRDALYMKEGINVMYYSLLDNL